VVSETCCTHNLLFVWTLRRYESGSGGSSGDLSGAGDVLIPQSDEAAVLCSEDVDILESPFEVDLTDVGEGQRAAELFGFDLVCLADFPFHGLEASGVVGEARNLGSEASVDEMLGIGCSHTPAHNAELSDRSMISQALPEASSTYSKTSSTSRLNTLAI
jgi:hypothetical protein